MWAGAWARLLSANAYPLFIFLISYPMQQEYENCVCTFTFCGHWHQQQHNTYHLVYFSLSLCVSALNIVSIHQCILLNWCGNHHTIASAHTQHTYKIRHTKKWPKRMERMTDGRLAGKQTQWRMGEKCVHVRCVRVCVCFYCNHSTKYTELNA